jgi:hypothetical protein
MKPLSRLEPLTDDQRSQIAAWLNDYHSYEKIIALTREQFGVEIPRMTLSRFRQRLALLDGLGDSPEAAQAAAELIQYAATGKDTFSNATLHVLERHAFELSFTCVTVEEDMAALKAVSAILSRHQNAGIRQRMATVQEQKCNLRQQEIKLKAAVRGVRMDEPRESDNPAPIPGPAHSPTPDPPSTIPFPDSPSSRTEEPAEANLYAS